MLDLTTCTQGRAAHLCSAAIWSHSWAVTAVCSLCHFQHIISKDAGDSCFQVTTIRPSTLPFPRPLEDSFSERFTHRSQAQFWSSHTFISLTLQSTALADADLTMASASLCGPKDETLLITMNSEGPRIFIFCKREEKLQAGAHQFSSQQSPFLHWQILYIPLPELIHCSSSSNCEAPKHPEMLGSLNTAGLKPRGWSNWPVARERQTFRDTESTSNKTRAGEGHKIMWRPLNHKMVQDNFSWSSSKHFTSMLSFWQEIVMSAT